MHPGTVPLAVDLNCHTPNLPEANTLLLTEHETGSSSNRPISPPDKTWLEIRMCHITSSSAMLLHPIQGVG